MPNLFGLDIAGILATSIASAGNLRSGTLSKLVRGQRDPSNLTAEVTSTESTFTFQGFLESGQRRVSGSRTTVSGDFISILGASVTPTATPAVNDDVTIDGERFELIELIERDPAAALYVFRVREKPLEE